MKLRDLVFQVLIHPWCTSRMTVWKTNFPTALKPRTNSVVRGSASTEKIESPKYC